MEVLCVLGSFVGSILNKVEGHSSLIIREGLLGTASLLVSH